jgi:signal transduction histidine kinase
MAAVAGAPGAIVQRYRLTLVFLAVSATTIGLAALAINVYTARTAEANVISLARAQAERDTGLIASLAGGLLGAAAGTNSHLFFSAPVAPGTGTSAGTAPAGYSELLAELDVRQVALFDVSGATVWHAGEASGAEADAGLLISALRGEVSSALKRNAAETSSGDVGDVVETYVPLVAEGTGETLAVLGIFRDVTGDLRAQAGNARSGLMRTTVLSLTGAFVVLLGFVMAADSRISRVHARSINEERGVSQKLSEEKDRLQQLNEAKSDFLAVVSHELLTPLTSTIAFLDLVLRNKHGTLHATESHQLEVARRNAQRLFRLIGDLLDMARAEKGALKVERKLIEVRAWLDEAVQAVAPGLAARKQPLELSLPQPGSTIYADRDRLTQALTNLLGNASKYSADGSPVSLQASLTPEQFTVTVRDRGIGMTADEQRGLFTMFYRAANSVTQAIPGSGIGLAITKQVVTLHGGAISLTSAAGQGTTVTFSIPVNVPGADDTDASNGHTGPQVNANGGPGHSPGGVA